jgi:hypothetical protein
VLCEDIVETEAPRDLLVLEDRGEMLPIEIMKMDWVTLISQGPWISGPPSRG